MCGRPWGAAGCLAPGARGCVGIANAGAGFIRALPEKEGIRRVEFSLCECLLFLAIACLRLPAPPDCTANYAGLPGHVAACINLNGGIVLVVAVQHQLAGPGVHAL